MTCLDEEDIAEVICAGVPDVVVAGSSSLYDVDDSLTVTSPWAHCSGMLSICY